MEMLRKMENGFVCLLTALLLTVGMGFTAGADVLDTVPEGSVFCVRINNFDNAFGQFDQFLAGVSPMGVSMLARMQLGGMLGDPSLQGLDTTGSFAVFGIPVANEATGANDIVVAGLLPVRDYELFVSLSPSVGEPDANGVSKIVSSGMGGPSIPMFAIKAGQFAMVGPETDRDKILKLVKSNGGSMAKSLDAAETKLATEMPMWAYGDIVEVNKAFGPMIQDLMATFETEMKKGMEMSGGPQMANVEEMAKVYMDLVKKLLAEGKYASIGIKPEPNVLRLKKTIAAKADTDMAKILAADATLPKTNKLVGYLEDGAAMNMAFKVPSNWMEEMSELGMSFMKTMAPDANSAQWASIVKNSIEANGNLMAGSLKANSQGKPPFILKAAQSIKDKAKHQQVIDESIKLMKTNMMSDMAKASGIKVDYDFTKGTGKYKDVTIDSAKLTFEVTDTNSPHAQMMAGMYGEGFDYRFAYVGDLYLTAVGGDPNMVIRELIDTAKAGSVATGSEVKAAMDLLPGAEGADFVGTINYLRLMQMATGFMPMPMPLPFDQIPTSSNMAFAGKAADGKLVVDVALPKQHVTEIMSGMMMMQGGTQGGCAPQGQ